MAKEKNLRTGEKQARTRDSRGRFVKGVTGNPGGRPKNDNVSDRLFPLVPKAIERIKMILDNPESTDRDVMKAAEIVLDRVYGKAFQSVQLEEIDTTVHIIEDDPEASEWNG
jgi:hypothetical protein